MAVEFRRAWMRLRVLLRPDGSLAVAGRDSSGWAFDAPLRSKDVPASLFEQHDVVGERATPRSIHLPKDLATRTTELRDELPTERPGNDLGGPLELPIFVEVDDGIRPMQTTATIQGWLEGKGLDRIVVVLAREGAPRPRTFRLPLKILLVGGFGAEVIESLGPMRSWIREGDAGGEAVLQTLWVEEADGVGRAQADDFEPDVLMLDGWDCARLDLGIHSGDKLPLAIVGADPAAEDWDHCPMPDPSLARSTLLTMDTEPGRQSAAMVLDGLAHDLPLHEALARAYRAAQPAAHLTLALISDEVATNDLRLSSAAAALVAEGREYGRQKGVGSGEVTAVPDELRTVALAVDGLDLEFGQETSGLWPLGWVRSALDHVLVRRAAPRLEPGEEVTTGRVVDIAIRHSPPEGSDGLFNYVKARQPLLEACRYLVEVSIGAGWLDSIVEDPPPPIDALLPSTEPGWSIDVSIVGRGIEVKGRAVKALELPRVGPSKTLEFPFVVLPAVERAWARVSFHYRNRLLQTFLVQSTVKPAADGVSWDEAGLRARLQYSDTSDWTNLDQLTPRSVSFIVNQGPAASHQLVVNRNGKVHDANFEGGAQVKAAKRAREILRPLSRPDLAQGNDEKLKELALAGDGLHRAMFNRLTREGRDEVRTLVGTADQVIQIVRVDENQVLPWSMVYDWFVPAPEDVDATKTCFGTSRGGACGHSEASEVVCVRGFWGVRHQIEEVIGLRRSENRNPRIAVQGTGPLVGISIGTSNKYTKQIPKDLIAEYGKELYTSFGSGTKLLDLLWDADQRPGVFVLVGHHERVGDASQIQSATQEKWLRERDIHNRAKQGDWDRPGPMVLLMACDSAAASATDLNSLVLTLSATGATGILGTEIEIRSDAAHAFSVEFLAALIQPEPQNMAYALQHARQALVIDRKDLRGFAFTAFGTADAHVVRS